MKSMPVWGKKRNAMHNVQWGLPFTRKWEGCGQQDVSLGSYSTVPLLIRCLGPAKHLQHHHDNLPLQTYHLEGSSLHYMTCSTHSMIPKMVLCEFLPSHFTMGFYYQWRPSPWLTIHQQVCFGACKKWGHLINVSAAYLLKDSKSDDSSHWLTEMPAFSNWQKEPYQVIAWNMPLL